MGKIQEKGNIMMRTFFLTYILFPSLILHISYSLVSTEIAKIITFSESLREIQLPRAIREEIDKLMAERNVKTWEDLKELGEIERTLRYDPYRKSIEAYLHNKQKKAPIAKTVSEFDDLWKNPKFVSFVIELRKKMKLPGSSETELLLQIFANKQYSSNKPAFMKAWKKYEATGLIETEEEE